MRELPGAIAVFAMVAFMACCILKYAEVMG